ncbi:MAG: glutamate N-acetyltransferase / amino-acid N-acetyltransferase [Alphaproteobacteria bacterium]|nr:MAG: glutamate N-acetyltransferase / amino-acid N-acetyltransferase [Alphaproteobacteria bacterium]
MEATFNRISVDADMSTNDSVFILANGAAGVRIRPNTPAAKQWSAMLQAVCQRLASLIVKDGEGATRVATIEVVRARSDTQALRCARQIAGSSLVRTMLAGGDPNVGRIAAAAGASGAWFRPEALEIRIGGHTIVSRGDTNTLGKELVKRGNEWTSVRGTQKPVNPYTGTLVHAERSEGHGRVHQKI